MKKELTPGQFWGIAIGVAALAVLIFLFTSGSFGGSGQVPVTEKLKPDEAISKYEAYGATIDDGKSESVQEEPK
jgi:hypothetical protein